MSNIDARQDSELGSPRGDNAKTGRCLGFRESTLIIAAAALQIGLLGWMAIAASGPLRTGTTVLLKVEPLDPRDLFRGDHVILSYSFSRTGSLGDDAQGSPAYVTLVPEADGAHYRAELPSISPPRPGTLYLRGTFSDPGRATFGIETFYVQEKTGHDYERAVRDHRLWAEIAVAPNGQGTVRRLVIE